MNVRTSITIIVKKKYKKLTNNFRFVMAKAILKCKEVKQRRKMIYKYIGWAKIQQSKYPNDKPFVDKFSKLWYSCHTILILYFVTIQIWYHIYFVCVCVELICIINVQHRKKLYYELGLNILNIFIFFFCCFLLVNPHSHTHKVSNILKRNKSK